RGTCTCCSDELKALFTEWIENKEDVEKSRELAEKIVPMVNACDCDLCKKIAELSHYLVKRSQWIIGGDGASYDIGFGGLDHVLASGKNVNILVLDTEVYSNTGGQASKATPVGATSLPHSKSSLIDSFNILYAARRYGAIRHRRAESQA
ncbi:MAG: thiamine pyrophosphate-dependent enzyme, partial [Barnesiella sp.]